MYKAIHRSGVGHRTHYSLPTTDIPNQLVEFKRLLDDSHYERVTFLSIAHEAGFNSKSTFNAIFKKLTG